MPDIQFNRLNYQLQAAADDPTRPGYSRPRLRAAAAWVWTDADRRDVQLGPLEMDVHCDDEVVVRDEETLPPPEQPADGGQPFPRRHTEPRRHVRAQVRDGVTDVSHEHRVPDGRRKSERRP